MDSDTRRLGEKVDAVADELGLSALGEIANIITGNAATNLAQLGYDCDISPPAFSNRREVK